MTRTLLPILARANHNYCGKEIHIFFSKNSFLFTFSSTSRVNQQKPLVFGLLTTIVCFLLPPNSFQDISQRGTQLALLKIPAQN